MESPPISVTLADTKGHYGTPFKKNKKNKKKNNNSGPLHRWKEGQRKNTNEDHNHFLWETTTNRTFTEYTTKNRSDRQYIELKTYGTGVENLTNKKGNLLHKILPNRHIRGMFWIRSGSSSYQRRVRGTDLTNGRRPPTSAYRDYLPRSFPADIKSSLVQPLRGGHKKQIRHGQRIRNT